MKAVTKDIKKPVFKWAWQKLEAGDYTDKKSFEKAMKEYRKLINNATK